GTGEPARLTLCTPRRPRAGLQPPVRVVVASCERYSSAVAAAAASAAAVPARFSATHPSMLRCGATLIASAPAGTSLRMTAPAPEYAPSPIVTGATNTL